jgi:hypothetical protein
MSQQSTTTLPFTSSSVEDTWKRKGARLLPPEFQPTPNSVIIGRAKKFKEAVGNQRFPVLAELHLPTYSGASCKVDKSLVVTSLVMPFEQAVIETAALSSIATNIGER